MSSNPQAAVETLTAEQRLKVVEERARVLLERTKALLNDPLSRETRNERKGLLVVSAIGILVKRTGLIPSKISALGIEFSPTEKVMLLRTVAAVIAYFIVAFMVYAWADYLTWRTTFRAMMLIRMRERVLHKRDPVVRGLPTERASLVRVAFEFVFPVALGICGILLLLAR